MEKITYAAIGKAVVVYWRDGQVDMYHGLEMAHYEEFVALATAGGVRESWKVNGAGEFHSGHTRTRLREKN